MMPLLGQPIVEHALQSLKAAGVTDIILVQSPPRSGDWSERAYFGDGRKLGLRIRHVVQKKPTGQGNALLLAKHWLDGEFLLVQPENINAGLIAKDLLAARRGRAGGVAAAQPRQETWLFGVFALKGRTAMDIVEKPPRGKEPSNLCNMGVYLLGPDYLSLLEREPSHPFSGIRALAKLAKRRGLAVVETAQPFFPLKYPWHLFAMRDYLLANRRRSVAVRASVAKSAAIEGLVIVEEGAEVAGSAIIKGPAYIGKNAVVDEFTILRPGCVLEADVVLRPYTDLSNCLIGPGTHIHRSYLGNSILGADVRIDANLAATNTRLDRGEISVDVKGRAIATDLRKMGTVIGRAARFGVNVSIMPGAMIGANCEIGANTVVTENVPDGYRLYAKQQHLARRQRVEKTAKK